MINRLSMGCPGRKRVFGDDRSQFLSYSPSYRSSYSFLQNYTVGSIDPKSVAVMRTQFFMRRTESYEARLIERIRVVRTGNEFLVIIDLSFYRTVDGIGHGIGDGIGHSIVFPKNYTMRSIDPKSITVMRTLFFMRRTVSYDA